MVSSEASNFFRQEHLRAIFRWTHSHTFIVTTVMTSSKVNVAPSMPLASSEQEVPKEGTQGVESESSCTCSCSNVVIYDVFDKAFCPHTLLFFQHSCISTAWDASQWHPSMAAFRTEDRCKSFLCGKLP